MLQAFGEKAHLGLIVECVGDLYICEHHTVEDVALAVGQSLCEALADRRGCVRMAVAQQSHHKAAVEVVMDLSNRPGCFSDIKLNHEMVGDMSAEMVVHFFESIASSTRLTMHLVQKSDQGSDLDRVLAAAAAMGTAFEICGRVDPRRSGKVASSKGTLSV